MKKILCLYLAVCVFSFIVLPTSAKQLSADQWATAPVDDSIPLPEGVREIGIYHFANSESEQILSWNLSAENCLSTNTPTMLYPAVISSTYSTEQPADVIRDISNLVAESGQDPFKVFLSGTGKGADKALMIATQAAKKQYAGIILFNPLVKSSTINYAKIASMPVYIVAQESTPVQKLCRTLLDHNCNLTSVITTNETEYQNKIFDDAILSWILRTPTKSPVIKDNGNPLTDKGEVEIEGRKIGYFVQLPRVDWKSSENFEDSLMKSSSSAYQWPLIMDLHGVGGHTAIDEMIAGNNPAYGYEDIRPESDCGYFRVFPRSPDGETSWGWQQHADLMIKVIDTLKEKYNIDDDRVYLTGFSMGGCGTWDVAMAYPDYFAALAPVASRAYNYDGLYTIRHIPTLLVHGILDTNIPYANSLLAYSRLKSMRSNTTLVTENGEHVLTTESRSEGVTAWLLRHRRGDQKTPAIVNNLEYPKAPTVKKVTDQMDYILGKAVAYSTVTARSEGKIIAETTSESNGSFMLESPKYFKSGTKLKISTKGMYGHEGDAAAVVVLDVTPPKKPVITRAKRNQKSIRGKSESNATVYIQSKGKIIGKSKANQSGKFTVKLKKKMLKNTVIYVYAKDKAKNKSALRRIKIK